MMTEAMPRPEQIIYRVEGFRDPQLDPHTRRALEAREDAPVDMSVAGVLAAARAQTDLDDFGPSDFEVRLRRLLDEVGANPNVWKQAKATFFSLCVDSAAKRLRNRDFVSRHPQLHDIAIDRPIFVVGLPRSGTTHLENLIAADRRLRHLPTYLGFEPVPRKGDESGSDGRDPRWVRANQYWEKLKADPVREAMHEYSPDHACGDNELQMADFASYQWEWLADVPGWRDFYLSEDQTPHYEYGREMIKAIALQFPDDRRWLLKGNQHNEQLPVLTRVYPDATVVMIHRDPLAILQSVLTMRGLAVLADQKSPDIAGLVEYWVDRVERMLRAYIRDMDVVPAGHRIDLLFQDVIADDIRAAQTVLEGAGLPSSDESLQDLRDYMAAHPRGRAGRVVYDIRADFGLDPAVLRERFRFYTDRFPIKPEVV